VRSRVVHYVYSKKFGNHFICVVLYVDDISLVKSQLSSKFDMKDIDTSNFIMGMDIKRDCANKKLWLNQRKYVETILERFNMHGSKSIKVPIPIGVNLFADQCPKTQEEEEDMSHVPYASEVGSLLYAMVYTRLDIAHVVGVLSRDMSNREGALHNSKKDLRLFMWYYYLWIVIPRKTDIG
jgi:hypothetical protein